MNRRALAQTQIPTLEELPDVPMLLLDWRETDEVDRLGCRVWMCDYVLRFRPSIPFDIRLEEDQTHIQASLGGTKVSGAGPRIDPATGSLPLPFRDGVHIQGDAERLGLPGYVRFEGRVQRVADIIEAERDAGLR